MTISLRSLAIGSSALVALSLTGTAAALSAKTATAADTAAIASQAHFHPFTIVSPDFREDTFLPVSAEFGGPGSAGSGCSGKNLAPALHWYNVPAGTRSFAFTITDVDAPVADGFHHWIVYNIPRKVTTLHGHGSNPFGEGTNDYGTVGYGGPCPPPDSQVHHYVFTVYALSVSRIAGTHITFGKLITEISPHVAGAASTIGKFRLPLGS
ncbi:MAG: YbhB/YbcL family Raf kinase inhibitor-like protein [Streptosporangiaceae bacterium]|nr:YbhB/YbcL family Raf kinase inhibitor-like protein [Streptosporangiaceae bacterium]MBV9856019.1 YbhB/YbcL family Raf kinase inhibitor-like protein [Streptosporangiaceae bacterium]